MATEKKEEPKVKVRLQKLNSVFSTKPLEYAFIDRDGRFFAYDEALNPITREQFDKGVHFKKRQFAKTQKFVDIEITLKEKAILAVHPFVKWEGNPNQNNILFEMIEVAEKSNKEVKEIKKFKQIINLIDGMSVKQVYELCNYMGENVVGMDMNDIYIMLLDRHTGKAYAQYDRVIQFKKDPDAEMISVINRALILGLIERKGDEFYFGGKIIASGLSELHFYCKNNEDFYASAILAKVQEKEIELPITIQFKENFIEAADSFEQHESEKEAATEYTDEDVEWFKQKFKEQTGMVHGRISPNKLAEKVLVSEANKAEWAAEKAKRKK
jgi:hypothetical protein